MTALPHISLCLLLTLLLGACGDRHAEEASEPQETAQPSEADAGAAPDADAPEPEAELQQEGLADVRRMWRQKLETGELPPEDEGVFLALIEAELLPEIHEAWWTVEAVFETQVVDVHCELHAEPGKLAVLNLKHMIEIDPVAGATWGDREYRGYRANARSRYYFMRVGDVELRFEGFYPAFRETEGLQQLVDKFALERFEEL